MSGASPGPSVIPSANTLSVSPTTLYLNNLPHNWSTLDLTSSLLFTCQPAAVFQPTQTTAFVLFSSAKAAQYAKRALSTAPPVQAYWAMEVSEGRDVRVSVLESRKLVREDVVKVSGLNDSDVHGGDGRDGTLLLSSSDVRSLLYAVNRLQCASTWYRFSAVESQRAGHVKRKSSGFLAELGERRKSVNGGLLSPVASSPTTTSTSTAATHSGGVSLSPAVAASSPTIPQQPVYSYPTILSPSMPPSVLPIPPPPPPHPLPAGMHSSDTVRLPAGFQPPPLPPPPMPPAMSLPMPPFAATYQSFDAASLLVSMSVDRNEPSVVSDGVQREVKRDDGQSDSKSNTWTSTQWSVEANGREDKYKQYEDREHRRMPLSHALNAQIQPLQRRGSDTERENDRSREMYQREERTAAAVYAEPRERDRERDRARDDRERKWDKGARHSHDRRADERGGSDNRGTWRDERDYHHSSHGVDDRDERYDRHERRDDSRESGNRRERRDDTKDERHSGERDRDEGRPNGDRADRYSGDKDRRDGDREGRRGWDDRRRDTVKGAEASAGTQFRPIASPARSPQLSTPQRRASESTMEEMKESDWSTERWRPQADSSHPLSDSRTSSIDTAPHIARTPASSSQLFTYTCPSSVTLPPSQQSRSEAERMEDRSFGQPGSGQKRYREEPKAVRSPVLRIGFS